MTSLNPIRRLHLGAMGPQHLVHSEFMRPLFDRSWLHLGDYDDSLQETDHKVIDGLRCCCLRNERMAETYFMPFWYQPQTPLPFKEASFSFLFSEHFLEHLFLDEACELLKECRRVLRPRGVFRIAVPDADLRTYEPPEPAGFSTGGPDWNDPGKHKSRWSIYSLSYILRWIGFQPVGIVFCDRAGAYINFSGDLPRPEHRQCLEIDLIQRTGYISRLNNSLVVDAVRL